MTRDARELATSEVHLHVAELLGGREGVITKVVVHIEEPKAMVSCVDEVCTKVLTKGLLVHPTAEDPCIYKLRLP